MFDQSQVLELCHCWYSAYASPVRNFFGLTVFIICIGKRLVTSTNLEYSFFFFCPQVKLMSALKCHLSTHIFLGEKNQMSVLADVACKLLASNDYSSDD